MCDLINWRETRPNLTVSFRLERGGQFESGFQDVFKEFDIHSGNDVTRIRVQHNNKIVVSDFYTELATLDDLRIIFSKELVDRLEDKPNSDRRRGRTT